MKPRFVSLALLHIRSTFAFSLPTREEMKKPKTILKTVGIAVGSLLLLADFGFLFVMMNLTMYEGLKPVGLQGMLLLNAASTASVLVFIMAFMMALSMFSTSGIESGFLVLPFTPPEMLGAKMILVYVTEALLGAFILIVAMVIYGIKEGPPVMFYLNGLLSAFALPLLPTALAYLVIVPLMNASKLFRNKNFILYVGGFLGMGFALAFNFYIQSITSKFGDPQAAAMFANPDSMMARLGKAWLPTWLAWKAFDGAASPLGFLAALGNLGLGLGCAAGVAALLGKPYVRSLQAYNETSAAKKKHAAGRGAPGGGMLVRRPLLGSLVAREIRLMNREPMYLLNGPFVMILMPALMAVVFAAQREVLKEMSAAIAPLLQGPGGYLVPAAFGAFLGSSTSIACTAVSRDAKALPWIKSLPIAPAKYFTAKLIHAEVFAVIGSLIGCGAGIALFQTTALDAVIALLLANIIAAALNMGGLWLDTAFPRIRWDNPIAAMKQNPNAVIAILSTMGLVGGLVAISLFLNLPRYAYAMLFGGVFMVPILAWFRFYPRFAARRYATLEA
jgi:ABC-2 type transport system permease protein